VLAIPILFHYSLCSFFGEGWRLSEDPEKEGVDSFRKPSCSPLEFSDGAGGIHVVHNTASSLLLLLLLLLLASFLFYCLYETDSGSISTEIPIARVSPLMPEASNAAREGSSEVAQD
jgi:hypothetical protein